MRKEISVLGPTSSSCGGCREMLPTKEILRSHALLRTCFFFFFCMGSSSGEDPNHRYPHEKRVDNGKRCSLHKDSEETSHILIHRNKTKKMSNLTSAILV